MEQVSRSRGRSRERKMVAAKRLMSARRHHAAHAQTSPRSTSLTAVDPRPYRSRRPIRSCSVREGGRPPVHRSLSVRGAR